MSDVLRQGLEQPLPRDTSAELGKSWFPLRVNRLLHSSPRFLGFAICLIIILTAFADWRIGLDLSLGVFYLLPILVASAVYSRPTILVLATICTLLRLGFDLRATPLETGLNFVLVMTAFAGSGLFVREVVDSRKRLAAFAERLQHQESLRQQAEDQLQVLAESSPAAIMTIDQDGRILAANQAALNLFGVKAPQGLDNINIRALLPILHDALTIADPGEPFRTAAQCHGRRLDGSPFHAHIWFSTYSTRDGPRLAAIAVDTSDEIREREENGLRQLLTSNRVLTAAVLHEIRNLCASISTAYTNLTSVAALNAGREAEVLGKMIEALGKVASANLQGASRESLSAIRLPTLLDQFRIIAEPAWDEINGSLEIRVNHDFPGVVADSQGLTQVLLNLMSNSIRAVEGTVSRHFVLETERRGNKIVLGVQDSGPGVQHPQALFVPFQNGAERVGLGLYLSRALMRSFGGDLRHVPTSAGCRFELEFVVAENQEQALVWIT